MKGIEPDSLMENHLEGYVAAFLHFFPRVWMENVLLPQTNKNLEVVLLFGELLRFLGLILFMSTVTGYSRKDFSRAGQSQLLWAHRIACIR